MLDCVFLDASLWLYVGFNAHKAIWFSGVVGLHFQRGREHAYGMCSNYGQPKAECDPTIQYTYVVYQTSLNCKLEKKRNRFFDLGKRFRAFECSR